MQRENVGIILDVTPQISGDGQVKLFIKQEVSSIAGPVSSTNSELVLNKREFETTVLVDDRDIFAIGGLLDDNERRTIEKLPLLSDIPLIGELFKSRSRSRTKTNLVVFIRPTILRSREDNAAVTAQRYDYARSSQKAANPKEEPSLDALVKEYMGAAVPAADGARPGRSGDRRAARRRPRRRMAEPSSVSDGDEGMKIGTQGRGAGARRRPRMVSCRSTFPMPSPASRGVAIVAAATATRRSRSRLREGRRSARAGRGPAASGAQLRGDGGRRQDPSRSISRIIMRWTVRRPPWPGRSPMGGDDLDFIAGDMPTAEDLLDSGDDAPAIRLINGIMPRPRVRASATSISSLTRPGWSCACAWTAC